jgi:N-acetylmuramoyl-L-alanine amidase
VYLVLAVGIIVAAAAHGATLERMPVEQGVYVCLREGVSIYFEISPPRGPAAQAFLKRYLAEPETWTRYQDRITVAVTLEKASLQARRDGLLALFPDDYIDGDGWWHKVSGEGLDWRRLAEWFTGSPAKAGEIARAKANLGAPSPVQGEYALIPSAILPGLLRAPARKAPPPPPLRPAPAPAPASKPSPAEIPVNGVESAESEGEYPPLDLPNELTFATDARGPHAVYKLKRGEALYTAVVVRYTDFRDHNDIVETCEIIQDRSGITDVRRMGVGQTIRIPMEMLSDRFSPAGSERRLAHEATLAEAERLKGEQVRTRGLEGVVVVIDPGHGGRDHGAAANGLYEDEIVYDIACRLKARLERGTSAKVIMTLRDLSQDYQISSVRQCAHDTDEVLLTTPNYTNQDARISANLRWYLANHHFRKELATGRNERKVIFISLHCDMLFNEKLRGAMVYIPGAAYRRDSETPNNQQIYKQYAEVRGVETARTTAAERRRDEALSLNFANTLLQSLRTHSPPLKVHSASQPIRNVIRQSGGVAYVPAVLRNNQIPTKVLVEIGNMNNATDREHFKNPDWREWFASATQKALEAHFE